MSNKIIYSCDSDDGSDMDVSDSDDGAQVYNQQQLNQRISYTQRPMTTTNKPQSKPHQRMVVSLHNYMKKDSWSKDAVKPKVENKMPLPSIVATNTSSYAAAAGRKVAIDPDENSDSDSSFHTAPGSPQRSDEDMEDLEPGQIASGNEYDVIVAKLEQQLQSNLEKEELLKKKLQSWQEQQESVRVRLLEQVRQSIVRNRKPVIVENKKATVLTPPTNNVNIAFKSLSMNDEGKNPVQPPQNNNKGKAPAVSKPINSPKRNKGKEPVAPRHHIVPTPLPLSQTPDVSKVEESFKPTITRSSLRNPGPNPLPLVITKKKKKNQKTPQPAQSSSRRLRSQDSRITHGRRLIDAVIDIPFSKRYRDEEEQRASSSAVDEMETDEALWENGRERRERKKKEYPLLISDEERRLTAPDGPLYRPNHFPGNPQAAAEPHNLVATHLMYHPPSLKYMRLILLNLYQQSLVAGQLSVYQEEFVKGLITKIFRIIEDYMTLKKEYYTNPDRLLLPSGDAPERLPNEYFGNLETLEFDRPDVSHYELFKIVRHFDNITGESAKKKSEQFLLKSGRQPEEIVLRTCDPADREDEYATLTSDETEEAHLQKKRKLTKQQDKAELKAKRRKANRQARRAKNKRLSLENAQLERDINMLSNQIALDMQNKTFNNRNNPAANVINQVNLRRMKYEQVIANAAQSSTSAAQRTPAVLSIDDSGEDDDAKQSSSTKQQGIKPISPSQEPSTRIPFFKSTAFTPINRPFKKNDEPMIQVYDEEAPKPFAVPSTSDELPIVIQRTYINGPSATAGSRDPRVAPPVNRNTALRALATSPIAAPSIRNAATPTTVTNSTAADSYQNSSARFQPYQSPFGSFGRPNLNQTKTQQPATTTVNAPPVTSAAGISAATAPIAASHQTSSTNFQPYRSALSSLGLHTQQLQQPATIAVKSSALCSAETSGGMCNDNDCQYTHFKDYF